MARFGWLRLVMAVLLPLHAGFAQAAMAMPAHEALHAGALVEVQAPAFDAMLPMADGMPCHHETEAAAAGHSSPHPGDCCDFGACHCVAACGLPLVIARLAQQRGQSITPFTDGGVPAIARPPDLRPPIR